VKILFGLVHAQFWSLKFTGTMNWLKNAAAQASQRIEATLQEAGMSEKIAGVTEKLAPVASVAMETRSLFSSLTSTLEDSFNKASSGTINSFQFI
jgi:hypothetical protein